MAIPEFLVIALVGRTVEEVGRDYLEPAGLGQ